jgi:hypothetical protein
MENSSIIIPSNIYSKPPFDGFGYSRFMQIYFITSGFLTIIANLYIIVLFALYKKLRQLQCNWLIVYLSAVEIFIGVWKQRVLLGHKMPPGPSQCHIQRADERDDS